jgi:hypothetical protein
MRLYKNLLLTGAIALSAGMALSACNNGGGDNMGVAQNPPSQSQPAPGDDSGSGSQPRQTAVFGDWVIGQFNNNRQGESAAAPVDVSKVDFKFKYLKDQHAFDGVLGGSSGQ